MRCLPHALGFSREQCAWYWLWEVAHSASMKVPWQSGTCPNYPSTTIRQQTPAPPFPHPQFHSFCKSQLTPPAYNFVIPLLHCFYKPILQQQGRTYLTPPGNWIRASVVGAHCHNHHAMNQYESQFWQFICSY